MSDWQTQFEAMRLAFLERARPRLQRTAELLQSLENGSQDDEKLHSLFKDMHWLAGVGGTYKLPELTRIGDRGERICDKCLTDGKMLTAEELATLQALVTAAGEVLAHAHISSQLSARINARISARISPRISPI